MYTAVKKGFTLLEVMVSLLVVAIALTPLVQGAAGQVNNANELRDKTFAQWVAINKVTEWRSRKFISSSPIEGDDMMGRQEWFWIANFIKTENKNIRRVEVSVYKSEENKDRKENAVVRFIAFLTNV